MHEFDALVADIRRYHVFSQGTASSWASEIPELRRRAESAETELQFRRALNELQNSLRDAHLRFTPVDASNDAIELGITIAPEWTTTGYRFVADQVGDTSDIRPGDVLTAIDDAPVTTYVNVNRFATAFATPLARASAMARFIVRRPAFLWRDIDGSTTRFRFERRDGHSQVTLQWKGHPANRPMKNEESVDRGFVLGPRCMAERVVNYGSNYRLVAGGMNVCVYTSSANAYPVVRVHSFLYESAQIIRMDHDLLAGALDRVASATKGIVLDLRDNEGGQNPNVFLNWFAPRRYRAIWTETRLFPELANRPEMVSVLFGNDGAKQYAELAKISIPGTGWRHPFVEVPGGPTGLVTRAPIALLVGPRCMSSCDAFAAVWQNENFGPIVGTQPARAFTVHRLPRPVDKVGTFFLALSSSYFDGDLGRSSLEGTTLRLDRSIEPTFATRERADAMHVTAAIEELNRR